MKLSASANWLSLLLVVGFCCSLVLSADNDKGQTSSDSKEVSKRQSLAPPKLFDFSRFKLMFKKRYNSVLEELARKKIFFARAFHAFLSFVSYKHYIKSHYLRVNEMSDWTNDELRSLEMSKFKNEHSLNRIDSIKTDLNNHAAADLDEIEDKLREIMESKKPGYEKIAAELNQSASLKSKRRKRDAPLDRSSLRLEHFLHDIQPEEPSQLLVEQVPSNNPKYEVPELSSFGAGDNQHIVSPTSALELKLISGIKGAGYLADLLNSAVGYFFSDKTKEPEEMEMKVLKKPDGVLIDHRDSGCFTPVKNQKKCGSCFLFSSLSLYEYQHCKETGKLVSFSEQYVIDCGSRERINGCGGGQEMDVSKFLHKYGIELTSKYPYRAKKDSCPYDSSTEPDHMGYLRVKEPQFKVVLWYEFDDYLKKMPIIMGFAVSPDLHAYGGGVDMGQKCDPKRAHSMLVVGSGIEDNIEYLLVRNSYSASWGENGYYKIAKSAEDCFLEGGMGWVLDPEEGKSVFSAVNELNDGSAVQRHQHFSRRFSNFLKDIVSSYSGSSTESSDSNLVTPPSK